MVYQRNNHILHLSPDAYRSKQILEEKYAEFAEIGWFVKGTDYRSITYHEIGHMFSNTHNIDGLRLSQDALGLEKWVDISELLEMNIKE